MQFVTKGFQMGKNKCAPMLRRDKRHAGNRVIDPQYFDTEMVSLSADLFGDPDFLFLSVRAGSDYGLPSPGHTTLTRLGPPGSSFTVDSFFDITYQIEFQGAPGGALDGLLGLSTGNVRLEQGEPPAASG